MAGDALSETDPVRPNCTSYFEHGHRRPLIDGIADGRVPLKFAYAGSAAFTHDQYASTTGYADMMTSAQRESDVLFASGACAPALSGVVEVGPGNGRHSVALLDRLRAGGLGIRRYLGLDFSATLLGISSDRLRRCLPPELRVDTAVWDMEGAPTAVVENWRPDGRPVLACLVGHTVGNFEDPVQAMRNLAGLLRPSDVLLASVLLRPMPVAAGLSMSAYRTEEFRQAALEPMFAAGMKAGELEFTVDYRDGAFVGEVTLLRSARLDGVNLPSGYRFRCFMSRRFESADVVHLFESAGWAICSAFVDQDSDHMTVVASRAEELR
ncbi:L-histidine N(alpha)-methyltransferase [Actinoplanes sp. LDG1-06]|uniref:L-histidine N(Alpha)-methyltransferase n=1 Tax=Paractinoplanes ovalisporus TaxID=2810368 RepID=A0ABS2A7N4_9ACTN|nr:L-histidine N(alpha)-methyltransferase [Actinoplanes ovalisporus]MBM2615855.1 L-histidine N(alpha)-methyltransferase [Actinoplanes ovalisporus]